MASQEVNKVTNFSHTCSYIALPINLFFSLVWETILQASPFPLRDIYTELNSISGFGVRSIVSPLSITDWVQKRCHQPKSLSRTVSIVYPLQRRANDWTGTGGGKPSCFQPGHLIALQFCGDGDQIQASVEFSHIFGINPASSKKLCWIRCCLDPDGRWTQLLTCLVVNWKLYIVANLVLWKLWGFFLLLF